MTRAAGLPSFRGRRCLVLGSSGFIGRWVARRLTAEAADLHLAVREPGAAGAIFARYGIAGSVHPVDLNEPAGAARLIRDLAPDIIFNAAGYGSDPAERASWDDWLAMRLNAELPGELARAAAETSSTDWPGRRVVHVGTVVEYGPAEGPLKEEMEGRPVGAYARSKLAGTMGVIEGSARLRLPAVVARICQVYGPGEPPGRLLPLLRAAARTGKLEPLTVGTQLKDFTHVEDVAEGLLRLAATSASQGEIVNLATGRLTTVRRFVLTAARLLQIDPAKLKFIKPLPDNELQQGPVALDRLRRLTGWSPRTTVPAGIRRSLAFMAGPGAE